MISAYLDAIESDNSDELCLPVLKTVIRERLPDMTNDENRRARAVAEKWSQHFDKLVQGMRLNLS